MVQDARDLAKHGTDELGARGDLDVEQLLDSQREDLFVGHHGYVVETVEVGQGLHIRLVLAQLLGTAVQQADVGIGTDDLLAIELENQTQHAVGGRVLRTEVDRVVANLAALDRVLIDSGARFLHAIVGRVVTGAFIDERVGRALEVGARGDQPRALKSVLGFGVAAQGRGGECADAEGGRGSRRQLER